jgi:RNA polymerase sigma-70 factor (ECF subfamily)
MPLSQEDALRLLLINRAKLLGYVRSIVHSADLAEDVFQNLSIVMLRKHEQIEDEASFTPWMFKTARFEALNARRKEARPEICLSDAAMDQLDEQWLKTPHATNSRLSDALEVCLQHLTPRARRLIQLRYTQDLSGEELAQKVDRKVNTVYVALSRIYQNLNRCIQKQMISQ